MALIGVEQAYPLPNGSDGTVLSRVAGQTVWASPTAAGAVVYQGTWNATTNTPALASGVGTKGFYYKVSVAGTTAIDGNNQWNAGDTIIFDGAAWDKIDGIANEVVSIAGLTGAISAPSLKSALAITASDVSGLGASALWNSVSFSGTIPFSGLNYMPRQVVSGAIAFTPASNPVAGAQCYVRVIADGVNVPSFAGFLEAGFSSGYNNTPGIDNQILFWYDGITPWYAVEQQVNAQPVAVPYYSSSQVTTGIPNVVAITFSAPLDTSQVPAASAFSVTASGGAVSVSSVALSGSVAALTMNRSIAGGETVTVSYTQPGASPIIDSTDTWLAPSFVSEIVTNSVSSEQVLRYTTLTSNLTESVDATFGYDYASSSGGFGNTGVSTIALPASSDGYIQAVMGGGTAVLGLHTSSSNQGFASFLYGLYANGGVYTPLYNGSPGTPTNVVVPAMGDILQIDRTGTTAVAQVSQNGGSTYTTVATWTGDAGAKLYGAIGASGTSNGKLKQIGCSANWA